MKEVKQAPEQKLRGIFMKKVRTLKEVKTLYIVKGGFLMEIEIEEQYDKIYRYCYFKVHNAHLAEDITQETFLRYLECDSYKDTGRPLAFLYTVARNLCMDEFRRKKTEELSEELMMEDEAEKALESISLQIAMETLSEHEQELILLRYVNEVPMASLSKMYGSSRFALYREIKGILRKLERGISDGTEQKRSVSTVF